MILTFGVFKVKYRLNFQYLTKIWSDCHKIKTKISIECWTSNVAINFYHGHDLYHEFFKVKYLICYIVISRSLEKIVRLPRNKKQHWLKPRPQMWPSILLWPWPWPFIGHVFNQPYVRNGWDDCHETENKFDWVQGIRCVLNKTDSYQGYFRCRRAVHLYSLLCAYKIHNLTVT